MNTTDKNFHINFSPFYAIVAVMMLMFVANKLQAQEIEEIVVIGATIYETESDPSTDVNVLESIIPEATTSGGYGSFLGYTERGTQTIHTTIFRNGVPANDAGSGWYDFGHDLSTGNEKVKIGAKQVDDGETKKGGGNLEEVIRGNHTFSIEGGISGAIGTREDSPNKDSIVTVAGNDVRQVGASFTLSVTGQSLIKSVEESSLVSDKRLTAFSAANIDLISGTVTNLKAGTNMNIKSEAVGTLLFSGNSSTVTAKNGGGTAIELTGHVHGQPDTGVDATVQGNTLAPVA